MAKTAIIVGSSANDGTGDPLRTAMQSHEGDSPALACQKTAYVARCGQISFTNCSKNLMFILKCDCQILLLKQL